MSEDTEHDSYELSRSSVSDEGSLHISIKALKIFSQAVVLLVAGAIGGGGTTLAVRSINPLDYDRFTGAQADRMARDNVDKRALIWKEVNRHMQINKERVKVWEQRFDTVDHDIQVVEAGRQECFRRMDRLASRMNRLENRMWKSNQAHAEGVKGLVWFPTH